MALTLRWRGATALPVDADGLTPNALQPLSEAEAGLLRIGVGNGSAELGELFEVKGRASDGDVTIEGNLRQIRSLGRAMSSGRLTIRGDAGEELGAEMTGGAIDVDGSVGSWAGAEMRGGTLTVRGNAEHFLGAAYPGSRLGMRDGLILVDGTVGDDAGLAMRRGLIAIGSAAGHGLGRGMIAGSIFAFGPVGRFPGAGMKRGTLALFGLPIPAEPGLLPSFLPSGPYRPPFLDVYLRRLRELDFRASRTVLAGAVDRYNGDLVERGQGEILVCS